MLSVAAFAAQPAKWGVSADASLFYNCFEGHCRGNDLDVSQWIERSFSTNLVADCQANYGSARIEVQMRREGDLFLPTITGHARSTGPNTHWNDAYGVAIEGYRYTGNTNKTLRFTGSLNGRSSGTREYEGLEAEVYFFKSDGFTFERDLPTLLYETAAKPITNFTLNIRSTNSGASLSQTVSLPVAPNETIHFYASLYISIFQVNGFTETLDGFKIVCDTPDNLTSESLALDRPLEIQSSTNFVTLTIPPSRHRLDLQQAHGLGQEWTTIQPSLQTNTVGFLAQITNSTAAKFWRARWE